MQPFGEFSGYVGKKETCNSGMLTSQLFEILGREFVHLTVCVTDQKTGAGQPREHFHLSGDCTGAKAG